MTPTRMTIPIISTGIGYPIGAFPRSARRSEGQPVSYRLITDHGV